jgi:hypothetical protein
MMSSTLEEQLKLLVQKVDRILSLLETRPNTARRRAVGTNIQKEKSLPLSPDEITRHQERFEMLYEIWDAGEELQVVNELEAMQVEELRRFADANNLNVTSKTPKQKVMKLIAGRFRERRQLMRSHSSRRSTTD